MMFWRQLGLSDAAAAVLAVLVMIISAGAWLIVQGSGGAQVPVVEPVVEQPIAPVAETALLEEQVAPIAEIAVAEPEEEPVQIVEEPVLEEPVVAAEPLPTAPKLDVVRVSPEGDAVVAGTADAGTTVVFLVNGSELARTQADGSGSFVGLFELPVTDQPNAITVAAEGPNGELISDESVLMAAIQAPAEPKPEPEEIVVADLTPVVEPETPETPAAPEPDLAPDSEPEQDNSPTPEVIVAEDVLDVEEPTSTEVAELAPAPSEASDETPVQIEAAEDVAKTEEIVAVEGPVEEGELAQVDTSVAEPEPEAVAEPVVVQDDVAVIAANNADTGDATPLAARSTSTQTPETRDAPAIVVASRDGVKVLQPARQPQAPTIEATANVVIDTITYDTDGEVALVGRGSGEGFVRVYLNDKPILTVPVDPDGSWETPLADVDAGVYQLRVDELSAAGDVTSRVETPFQREEVALAADAPPTAITVQPGSTLWAIARDRFGDGVEYVRVYEANRDLIRDPDLIYPGQVFALPTE